MTLKTTMMMGALVLLGMTAACKHEGSTIQKKYTEDRKECRSYAEVAVGHGGLFRGGAADGEEGHVELVTQFANCMHKRGWAVNKPPGAK